jgi:hypothetical protein
LHRQAADDSGMTRRTCPLLLLSLLPSVVLGWQLSSETLEQRVRDASLIVVGKVAAVHSRTTSPIAGVGDAWRVGIRVSALLKGSAPKVLQVTFVDAAIQDFPSFRPDQDRVWLLKATSDPGLFSAPASYESVLVATEEPHVRTLLSAPVPSAPSKQRN